MAKRGGRKRGDRPRTRSKKKHRTRVFYSYSIGHSLGHRELFERSWLITPAEIERLKQTGELILPQDLDYDHLSPLLTNGKPSENRNEQAG
jgi:hypothetical protein